jgi:hypothetical protein
MVWLPPGADVSAQKPQSTCMTRMMDRHMISCNLFAHYATSLSKCCYRFAQFTQAICLTMPYSVVVFTVRDFMLNGASTDAATEAQIGKAAGLLAGKAARFQEYVPGMSWWY